MPSYDPRQLVSPRGKSSKKKKPPVRNSTGRQDELREMGRSRANGSSRDYMEESTGRRSGSGSGGGQPQNISNGGTASDLDPVNTTRPQSALGRDVDFSYYPDLFSNPGLLAQKWGEQNGLSPTTGGGMQKVQQDLASVLPQLFYLTQGQGGNASDLEYSRFLDFADSFMNMANGVGGATGAIGSGAVGNIFDADPSSMLSKFLNNPNLDTSQQMNNLLGLIGGGLSTSMPGAMASALMGEADQLSQSWFNQQTEAGAGGNQSLVDFLKSKGYDQMFR